MIDEKPCSNSFHPYKCFLDKLLYLIVFRPLNYIVKLPWNFENDDSSNNNNNNNLQHYMDKLRARTSTMEGLLGIVFKRKIRKYKKNVVSIPRNNSILVSTSSCNNDVTQPMDSPSLQSNDDMMNATILYPPHLHEKIFPNNNDDDNTTRRKLCFHEIDSNIPIILFFHGGGFIMGESLDLYTAMAFENLVTVQTKKHKSSSSLPDLVFVSIEYRLAPEHPFPCAVIDCLSFMEHACSTECSPKNRKFHLAGTSAGGNLCTMVTMEHLRRILSVLIDIPFLDPNANSISYYRNSKSSMTQWLIWCWRSYLSSKITTTATTDNDKDGGDNYILNFSTNQIHVETWMNQAKKKDENHMFRYIYPTIGIPPATSNKHHDNIKFIIVTSLADPLHDEGVELVNKMKEMGYTKLKHYETISGHATYFWCDKSMTKRIFDEWSNYIFQS